MFYYGYNYVDTVKFTYIENMFCVSVRKNCLQYATNPKY